MGITDVLCRCVHGEARKNDDSLKNLHKQRLQRQFCVEVWVPTISTEVYAIMIAIKNARKDNCMGSDYKKNTALMIEYLGGAGNIVSVTNCMTRVRTVVKDEHLVDEKNIQNMGDVLGLVHDRDCSYEIVVGPGKSRKYADQFHEMGLKASADEAGKATADWQKNKADLRSKQKGSRLKSGLKLLGDIFVPLIPGIITAGLCAGFAGLIAQAVPGYDSIKVWNIIYNLLTLVSVSFMTYLTAWAGYRAAERFGVTPILGGMLGMITSLDGINTIAQLLGLYDEQNPLSSILRSGKGGVLAVIVGVFLLSIVEKKIRSKMPESIDVIFTPLLSLLICTVPYILVIMPLLGYVSSGIVWVFSQLCLSSSIVVRIIAGYTSAALFLPLVAAGMHHGMVALYTVQLQELGYITLYPALAMAGAGQVGACIALWIKAKRVGNKSLCSVIAGALPAGFLGIGEPLIYGVTLPLGKPFITAGLGAGFGGALVMAAEVASTTWGPSGLLGIFVMTDGPCGAVKSALIYLAGLIISYICAFIITSIFYSEKELLPETADETQVSLRTEELVGAYQTVRHGDPICLGGTGPDGVAQQNAAQQNAAPSGTASFEYVVNDPIGLHARPAGRLAEIAKNYDCKITLTADGKTVSATSPIEMMNLGISKGTKVIVSAEGQRAQIAIRDLKKYMEETL